ncbi:transposase [Escherichia coli O91:H21 str. 2009C-3740]|nr:transposase [Escherichia coli O91:H21 str. 2009C-3740]
MHPLETIIWLPEFTDKMLSRKSGGGSARTMKRGLWADKNSSTMTVAKRK